MRRFVLALFIVFVTGQSAQAAMPPGDVSCSGTDTGIICSVSLNFSNGYSSSGGITYYWDFAKNIQPVFDPYSISSYGTRTFFKITEPNAISLTYQELLTLAGGDASATLVLWASPANSSNGGVIKNSTGSGSYVSLVDVLANKIKADKVAADKAAADRAAADKAAADKAERDSLSAYHLPLIATLNSSLERVQVSLHTFQDNFQKDSNLVDLIDQYISIQNRIGDFSYLQPTATKASVDSAFQSIFTRIDTLTKKIELAAQTAVDKAAADKAAADKAAADKAAIDLLVQQKAAAKADTTKKITITCLKGKAIKTVTAVKPVCPAGYKKK